MEPIDPVEARVLGCLLEKDLATPEYYPITLNALVNACNQKSNRHPVVEYDDEIVSDALDSLRHKGLAGVLTGGGNRVPKYNHRIGEKLNLGRRESAILCELLVRGPQTPGELRSNTARMHRFSDVEEVEACVRGLTELTRELSRQPGRRENRWAQLLTGEPAAEPEMEATATATPRPALEARLSALEEEVRELRQIVERLRADLGA